MATLDLKTLEYFKKGTTGENGVLKIWMIY